MQDLKAEEEHHQLRGKGAQGPPRGTPAATEGDDEERERRGCGTA